MKPEEFEEMQDEILKEVPKQYRNGCKKHAWDSGHPYGYREVLIHLEDLVDCIFGND